VDNSGQKIFGTSGRKLLTVRYLIASHASISVNFFWKSLPASRLTVGQ